MVPINNNTTATKTKFDLAAVEPKKSNDVFANYMDACRVGPSSGTIKSNDPLGATQKNLTDKAGVKPLSALVITNEIKTATVYSESLSPQSPQSPDSGIESPPTAPATVKGQPAQTSEIDRKLVKSLLAEFITNSLPQDNPPILDSYKHQPVKTHISKFEALIKKAQADAALLEAQKNRKPGSKTIANAPPKTVKKPEGSDERTVVKKVEPEIKVEQGPIIDQEIKTEPEPITKPEIQKEKKPIVNPDNKGLGEITLPETAAKADIVKDTFDPDLNKLIDNPIYSPFGSTKGENIYETIDTRNIETLIKDFNELDPHGNEEEWHKLVDSMFTIACGGRKATKAEAKQAEVFLLGLHSSGSTRKYAVLEKMLVEEKCLELFELVQQQNKTVTEENNNNPHNAPEILWKTPNSFSIIAGFQPPRVAAEGDWDWDPETENADTPRIVDNRVNIANRLNDNLSLVNYVYEGPETIGRSLFTANRLISASELDSFAYKINQGNSDIENKPYFYGGWKPNVTIDKNGPALDMDTIKIGNFSVGEAKKAANFSPILLNNHWYLFGTFYDGDKKQAIVFDSKSSSHKKLEEKYFKKLAVECGVTDKPTFIAANMQDNAPNACGLFVAKAMEKLSQHESSNYKSALNDWANDFISQPTEFQEAFNRQGRKELMLAMNETIPQEDA
ncbi:hypothetical protein SC206_14995 [Rouxiella sp. T17]|uniref:hypothetical protein n=1 Tax=Rouxiella sp. T17 TaxID=3085684 RepID=UPI002FCC4054